VPLAREVKCKVLQIQWLTPTVVAVTFEPSRKFHFHAGQFLSVLIPSKNTVRVKGEREFRRAYSLAAPFHPATGKTSYELSVKVVPGGVGSNYIASLKEGDFFSANAPYGDLFYRTSEERYACFISTGTGIAPFRAMVLSKEFHQNPPLGAISIFGAADEEEVIYPGVFSALGLEEVNALSRTSNPLYSGFKGRATDFLKCLPADWPWALTDFYLCGNGNMIAEVKTFLEGARGVSPRAIFKEVYFAPGPYVAKPLVANPFVAVPLVAVPLKKTG
jgi:ferredoxin-NADP reductase